MIRIDADAAREVFVDAFQRLGLPTVIRTDNGVPFATTGLHGLSRLSAWFALACASSGSSLDVPSKTAGTSGCIGLSRPRPRDLRRRICFSSKSVSTTSSTSSISAGRTRRYRIGVLPRFLFAVVARLHPARRGRVPDVRRPAPSRRPGPRLPASSELLPDAGADRRNGRSTRGVRRALDRHVCDNGSCTLPPYSRTFVPSALSLQSA